MPGVASLQKQQYYGHPRNAFWPIMAALTEETLPEEYQARKLMLLRHGIALWDVCQSCELEGSLDSNILCEHPNPIVPLLKSTLSIRAVAFNGQPAYRLFRRHIEKELHNGALRKIVPCILCYIYPQRVLPTPPCRLRKS